MTDFPLTMVTRIVCRECLPGSLPQVGRLIDQYQSDFLDQKVFEVACAGGASISTLEFLLARTPAPDWKRAVYVAAQGGHVHVVQWMLSKRRDRRGPWQSDFSWVPDGAAEHGHLEILRLLNKSQVGDFAWTMHRAAANGHLEVVKWSHKRHQIVHPPCDCSDAVKQASKHGHLAVVQWLLQHGAWASCSMFYAASGGHLNVLQWLYEYQHQELPEQLLHCAACQGRLDVAQWLYDHGDRNCDSFALSRAAGTGNLELVKWLHEHFSEQFTPRVMDNAAKGGHLEVVKWLNEKRNEGCTTMAMNGAARCGRLDIVQWLHFHRHEGCTTEAMDMAAFEGHLDVVQWLHRNRTEGCTNHAMSRAAKMGRVAIVRYLYNNNINRAFGEELRSAADQGHLEMMVVLVENQELYGWDDGVSNACVIERSVKQKLEVIRKSDVSERDRVLQSILGALEWLQNRDFHGCVAYLLQEMICQGYSSLVRCFLQNISDDNFQMLSQECYCRVLMRWIIENGPQICTSAAKKLATSELTHRTMEVTSLY